MLEPLFYLQKDGPAPGQYNARSQTCIPMISSSFKSSTPRFKTSHTVSMNTYLIYILIFSRRLLLCLYYQKFTYGYLCSTLSLSDMVDVCYSNGRKIIIHDFLFQFSAHAKWGDNFHFKTFLKSIYCLVIVTMMKLRTDFNVILFVSACAWTWNVWVNISKPSD